jgi:hypothetical protein
MIRQLIVWVVPAAAEDPLRSVLKRLGRPAARGPEEFATFLVGCAALAAVACVAVWLYWATRADGVWTNARRRKAVRR